jgi:hypothetical protein
MGAPGKRGVPALEARAYYSVPELARAGGVGTFTLLRLLRANRVEFMRVGRSLYVTVAEIRRKIPPLWEGLCVALALRTGIDPRPLCSSCAACVTCVTGHTDP